MRLVCGSCGTTYSVAQSLTTCPCGGLVDVEHDVGRMNGADLQRTVDARLGRRAGLDGSGVWRYRELIGDFALVVTRPEGNTALYSSTAVSRWTGVDDLHLKHEGENPTGSFKDRGMTVGVTQALSAGARAVVCASTGNTSSSLAAYAALAGLPCVVIVPAGKVAGSKLAQTVAYGAQVVQIEGDFDAALVLAHNLCRQMGLALLNSINPWRLEGQKAIVFEMVQQLGWTAPDWIVLPGGNLGNTAAFGKALRELRALNLLTRTPRLAVIQAANANPFYQAFRSGWRRFEPMRAHTVATAINIGHPANYPRARRAVDESNGLVAEVSDDAILEAKRVIDRAGIGCEPASAATVAGIRALARDGTIRPGDAVIGVLTGHLLKDADVSMQVHGGLAGGPAVVPADLGAIRTILEKATSW